MTGNRVAVAIIFCAINAVVASCEADIEIDNATSQERELGRYKDFLRYVREKVEAEKVNKAAIEELKAKRTVHEVERENARKLWIQIRDEEKKRFNEAARDEAIRAEEEKMRKERETKVKAYVERREQIRRTLQGAKQVDPHDEFQVGKNYEEFEYELIEEPEKK